MAMQWSSEFTVTDHKDLQATTMTMDWEGSKLLLAGKRQLAIKYLNDTSDNLRKYPHESKYEVASAEWNPTSLNGHFCALSTNQRVELVCWREDTLELAHTLCSHTRVVSDINWHRFDANVLASCSIDAFTHVWDIRDPRKPCTTFPTVASANHVRWNNVSSHILATAHDGDVRIWDERKGTSPVQYISAHIAKIHGLDWSPTHEYQLATCSQDGTVKFFDVTNPKRAESVIQTMAPVWRARYTPFGEGLLTAVVPQTQRGDNTLLLWNLLSHSSPVHTFVGHTDIVLEFEWRRNRYDTSEYQLITWSKDQSLRFWKIEPFLQKLCGHDLDSDSQLLGEEEYVHITTNDVPADPNNVGSLDTGLAAVESLSFTELSGSYNMERHITMHDAARSLEQEFSLLSANAGMNISFQDMDVLNRTCSMTAVVNCHSVYLHISFPPSYPFNAAPSFQIEDKSTVDSLLKTKLLKVLKQTAQQYVRKNRPCLESCLTQLVSSLENASQFSENEAINDTSRLPVLGAPPSLNAERYNLYGSAHDSHVPFPKTCGARFCSADMLVCFHRSTYSRRLPRQESTTPRSLSAAGSLTRVGGSAFQSMYLTSSAQDPGERSAPYYGQERPNLTPNLNRSTSRASLHVNARTAQHKTPRNVTVYDVSKLFFIHRELGEKYVIDTRDVASMCHKNAIAAATVGRTDLVQVWTLAALIASPPPQSSGSDPDEETLSRQHPFSKAQIQYLIMHYAKMSDIQTAAMLCCAFSTKSDSKAFLVNKNINSKSVSATPGGSPYHTIHPVDTSLEGWNFPTLKQNRSNSWSESIDDLKLMANIVEHREVADTGYDKQRILDERKTPQYDELKRRYADVLHMWNLLGPRVQVMKMLSEPAESHRGVEFLTECQLCKKTVLGSAYCNACKRHTLRCALCRILVRGSSNFCLACGHGGHAKHIMAWFATENVCPTGCGCKCLIENGNLIEC